MSKNAISIIVSVIMVFAMIFAFIPASLGQVSAATAKTPSSAVYVDKSGFENDTPYGLYKGDKVQAVYFGTFGGDKHKWMIAGNDGYGLVLISHPVHSFANQNNAFPKFESSTSEKSYSSSWGCSYTSSNPSKVYANHYGASYVRNNVLKPMETDTSYFSVSEQNLMLTTTIYTYDSKNKKIYSTADKLYLPNGERTGLTTDPSSGYFTVGANNIDADKTGNAQLNNGLKVGISTTKEAENSPFKYKNPYYAFWVRSPTQDDDSSFNNGSSLSTKECAMSAGSIGFLMYHKVTDTDRNIVPVFCLNVSPILFASSASAGTAAASFDADNVMTFRFYGKNKINSKVSYSSDWLKTEYDDNKPVYLYVQGNDGSKDWVYSQLVDASETIPASSIYSGADLSACRIWLETVTDDVAYAKPAEKALTLSVPAGESLVYNGKTQTGVVADTGCTLSGTTSGVDTGTYTALAVLDEGYFWQDGTTEAKTITWEIVKAVNKITGLTSVVTKTGSVSKNTAFTSAAKAESGTLKYSDNSQYGSVDSAGKVTINKNYTGTFKVTAYSPETANYKAATKSYTVKVKPGKMAVKKAVNVKGKKIKATWTKMTGADKYQIRVAQNSKMTKGKKTYTAKGTAASKTTGKLTKGKNYYVQIRAYDTQTKSWGAWSAKKKVKIRK